MNESISEKQLAEWIVDLETGEKRAPALVMELCLSEYLLPACSTAMGIAEYSCGWFHINAGDAWHWFRIPGVASDGADHTGLPRLSRADSVFLGKLAPLGHRFFAVTLHALTVTGTQGATPAPHLDFSVHEWSAGENPECHSSALARAYATDLSKTVNGGIEWKMRQRQRQKSENAANARAVLVKLIGAQKVNVLQLLLATRCLMNFGFAAPVDADALALDLSDEPVLLEFKRKYPSSGRRLTCAPPDGRKLVEHALDADAQVRGLSKNPAAGKSVFWGRAGQHGLTDTVGSGYGLDMSHLRTLLMCEQAGIRYRYLIWRSDKEKAGHARKEDGFQPEKLLRSTLVPFAWPDLKWKDIAAADVTGVTCTDGDGSGAFTRGVRVQAVFDAESGYRMVGAPPGFAATVITACPRCQAPVRTKRNGKKGCSDFDHCKWYEP